MRNAAQRTISCFKDLGLGIVSDLTLTDPARQQ